MLNELVKIRGTKLFGQIERPRLLFGTLFGKQQVDEQVVAARFGFGRAIDHLSQLLCLLTPARQGLCSHRGPRPEFDIAIGKHR